MAITWPELPRQVSDVKPRNRPMEHQTTRSSLLHGVPGPIPEAGFTPALLAVLRKTRPESLSVDLPTPDLVQQILQP